MNTNLPNNFTAKTSFGLFHVKITNGDYISIGSKHNCVQIAYRVQKNTAHLDWLGTEKGGCEQTGKTISGVDTVAMTDLGFTILRQLYPSVYPEITLRDSSKFHCSLPNGQHVQISNMPYNLLLKGKTYYQDKFDAHLLYPESELAYHAFRTAWEMDSVPSNFDFKNKDLNHLLRPILQDSNTWKDFFTKLYSLYGRKTCSVLFPWYLDVYGFLAKTAIHSDWKINIANRPVIEYDTIKVKSTRNITHKTFTYDPYTFAGGFYPSKISYNGYLKAKNRGVTYKKG